MNVCHYNVKTEDRKNKEWTLMSPNSQLILFCCFSSKFDRDHRGKLFREEDEMQKTLNYGVCQFQS